MVIPDGGNGASISDPADRGAPHSPAGESKIPYPSTAQPVLHAQSDSFACIVCQRPRRNESDAMEISACRHAVCVHVTMRLKFASSDVVVFLSAAPKAWPALPMPTRGAPVVSVRASSSCCIRRSVTRDGDIRWPRTCLALRALSLRRRALRGDFDTKTHCHRVLCMPDSSIGHGYMAGGYRAYHSEISGAMPSLSLA